MSVRAFVSFTVTSALLFVGCGSPRRETDASTSASADAGRLHCSDLVATFAATCPSSSENDRATVLDRCSTLDRGPRCEMERAALIECWASELQTAAGAVCTANVLDSYCDDALQALRVCDTSGTDAGPPAHCDGVAASAGELRVAVVPTPTSFDLLCVVDSESAQLMATRSSTGSTVDISLLGPGRGSVTTGQVGELSVVAAGTRSSGASFRCANDSGDLCTVCTALEGGKLVGTVHCPGLVCDDGAPPLALDASFHCP